MAEGQALDARAADGMASLMVGNLTDWTPPKQLQKTLFVQGDSLAPLLGAYKSVSGDVSSEAPPEPENTSRKQQAKAGKGRKRKPKRRGPRGSVSLEWHQVRTVDHLAHIAMREGFELNRCLTIRAPKDMPDAEGKRVINRYLKRVCEALKGRGQEWVAVWVYEKEPHLHAHALIYVAPGNLGLIMGQARRSDRTLCITRGDRCGPEYITKQRRPRSPEFEQKDPRLRVEGAYIAGPRVGYSKAAKALLARSPVPEPRREAYEPRVQPLPPEAPRTVMQLGLPLSWMANHPTSDAALMTRFCEVFGYTQQQAARQLGYSDRSHVANIIRGHDGMSQERRRFVQYLLETGVIREVSFDLKSMEIKPAAVGEPQLEPPLPL